MLDVSVRAKMLELMGDLKTAISASPISTSPTTLRPHGISATASRSCTLGG